MNQSAIAAAGFYAVISTIILFWLTGAISLLRRRHRVLIGDGDVKHLKRAMRGHANAIETIPMMMVLLVIAALMAAPVYEIHLLGSPFVIGRAIHAWHFIQEHGRQWQRAVGFGLSALAMIAAAAGIFIQAVRLMFF